MAFRQRLCSPVLRSTRSHALVAGRRPLAVGFSTSQPKRAIAAEDTDKGVVGVPWLLSHERLQLTKCFQDPNDSFLQGNTANYIDEMYMSWKKDPSSVHISWQSYFRNMEDGSVPISQAFQPPPGLISTAAVPAVTAVGLAPGQGGDLDNHLK